MAHAKKILLMGGTGFIGQCLGRALTKHGHRVSLLVRSMKSADLMTFPSQQFLAGDHHTAFTNYDAIINLAGESIADGRWSPAKKQRIIESRTSSAQQAVAIAKANHIKTIFQASAIGFYGATENDTVDEGSSPGNGFLSETVVAWESAFTESLEGSDIRWIVARLGVVFGPSGGALTKMISPYIYKAGASLGSHDFSWIDEEDFCRFILSALDQEDKQGIYNLTAPQPSSYDELHHILTDHFGGIRRLKLPRLMLTLALGEKSAMLLTSQRVVPKRLLKEGFSFCSPTLAETVKKYLPQSKPKSILLQFYQWIPTAPAQAWEFFSDEHNLERITPPSLRFRVVDKTTSRLEKGTKISYKLAIHGLPFRWQSELTQWEPPHTFQDNQLKGPYAVWTHDHHFIPVDKGTLIEDHIALRLPFGLLGRLVGQWLITKDVKNIFAYRKKVVATTFSDKQGGLNHDEP